MITYGLTLYEVIWYLLFCLSFLMIAWGEGIIVLQVGDKHYRPERREELFMFRPERAVQQPKGGSIVHLDFVQKQE